MYTEFKYSRNQGSETVVTEMFKKTPKLSPHATRHILAVHRPPTPRVRSTRTTSIHEQRRYLHRPRYAYFTLVMCGDEYAIGAAVLGWSLRKQGVQHELVVMVTPDVSIKTGKLLMKIYDRVERVKYVDSTTRSILRGRGYRQENSWVKYCLTKANMLKFVEYDKIIWMDADMLALGNLDVLFEISAPAGICTSIRDHERWHGELIPEQEIKESLLNNYGVKGCIMVLKPCIRHYLTSRSQQQAGHGGVYLGPDEYFFTMIYKNTWHHLNHKYGYGMACELNGIQPLALHYDNSKPWQIKEDTANAGDGKWWAVARDLVYEHPEVQGILPVTAVTRSTVSRSWVFLSPTEKVSYKLRNDYKEQNAMARKKKIKAVR